MRDGGKGDAQRPLVVPMEQFDSNWNAIFGGNKALRKAELEKRLHINLFPAIPDSVKSRTMELPEPRIRSKR